MADGQRRDRVPVLVRMSVLGVAELDVVAAQLGVSRSDVIRRAILGGLPKLQEEARFAAETGRTVL